MIDTASKSGSKSRTQLKTSVSSKSSVQKPSQDFTKTAVLETPIQFLKGVGPHFAQILKTRDITTVADLLEWYPRSYEDRRAKRNIADLRPGEIVSISLNIVRVSSHQLGKSKRRMYDVILRDNTGTITAKYFRVPYRGYFERFQPGMKVRVVGKVTLYRNKIEFHHPDIRDDDSIEELSDCLVPIYTETEGITLSKLRKIMKLALEKSKGEVSESLPYEILKKYSLPTRYEAIKALHDPPKEAGTDFLAARSQFHKRIIFEEFFWLELLLANKKSLVKVETAEPFKGELNLIEEIIQSLPFQLTKAQRRVLSEVHKDLIQPHPMHRLVQGDVGSGKTAVALLSCAFAIKNGYQAAIMVPTEILCEQHYNNSQKILGGAGIRIAMLLGSQSAKEKKQVIEQISSGQVDLVIGTHALIQEGVSFKNLGFVVVDEQHRFGVYQRQELKQKGVFPHLLLMTATPIPRTLAMTVYGDLDVSVIDELPPGRTPVVTRVTYQSKESLVYQFIREQVEKGRQAYIIYPLVEESEKIDLKNAVSEYEKLKTVFPQFKLGLLHGRMKADEKEFVMKEFRENNIQILVSTTVIEVGVDVPNATIMLIEHAERFGLSQLHQLRGRVGRGAHKSYCILKLGHAVSDEARDRTQIMADTSDGFKIAEADLEMRGPGEFMGTRQSGLTGFKMANLVRDVDLLMQAREAAFQIVKEDPKLKNEKHKVLKDYIAKQGGRILLGTVG